MTLEEKATWAKANDFLIVSTDDPTIEGQLRKGIIYLAKEVTQTGIKLHDTPDVWFPSRWFEKMTSATWSMNAETKDVTRKPGRFAETISSEGRMVGHARVFVEDCSLELITYYEGGQLSGENLFSPFVTACRYHESKYDNQLRRWRWDSWKNAYLGHTLLAAEMYWARNPAELSFLDMATYQSLQTLDDLHSAVAERYVREEQEESERIAQRTAFLQREMEYQRYNVASPPWARRYGGRLEISVDDGRNDLFPVTSYRRMCMMCGYQTEDWREPRQRTADCERCRCRHVAVAFCSVVEAQCRSCAVRYQTQQIDPWNLRPMGGCRRCGSSDVMYQGRGFV